MRKFVIILFCLFLLSVGLLYGFKWYCLKNQPVVMNYPKLPYKLETWIRAVDDFICFTQGIIWYEQDNWMGFKNSKENNKGIFKNGYMYYPKNLK